MAFLTINSTSHLSHVAMNGSIALEPIIRLRKRNLKYVRTVLKSRTYLFDCLRRFADEMISERPEFWSRCVASHDREFTGIKCHEHENGLFPWMIARKHVPVRFICDFRKTFDFFHVLVNVCGSPFANVVNVDAAWFIMSGDIRKNVSERTFECGDVVGLHVWGRSAWTWA
nr:putative integron gene cassette protein [uncultured bacterium]